jgi:cytochrome c biogenesis protein CcmG/thiol:disulfide interchange protein DsbE
MLKRLKFWLPASVGILILALFWAGLGHDPHKVPSGLVGHKVPYFSHKDLTDGSKSLNNNIFKGHVSILNIWASWCESCLVEHGALNHIVKRYQVPLYGLNYKDDRQQALKWLNDYGNPFQAVIYDPDGKAAVEWGITGTPESYVIDAQGIIRYKHTGPITHDDWQQTLWPLIKRLRGES